MRTFWLLFFLTTRAFAFSFSGGGASSSTIYHADNLDNGTGTNVALNLIAVGENVEISNEIIDFDPYFFVNATAGWGIFLKSSHHMVLDGGPDVGDIIFVSPPVFNEDTIFQKNVTASAFFGNGSALTGLTASQITGLPETNNFATTNFVTSRGYLTNLVSLTNGASGNGLVLTSTNTGNGTFWTTPASGGAVPAGLATNYSVQAVVVNNGIWTNLHTTNGFFILSNGIVVGCHTPTTNLLGAWSWTNAARVVAPSWSLSDTRFSLGAVSGAGWNMLDNSNFTNPMVNFYGGGSGIGSGTRLGGFGFIDITHPVFYEGANMIFTFANFNDNKTAPMAAGKGYFQTNAVYTAIVDDGSGATLQVWGGANFHTTATATNGFSSQFYGVANKTSAPVSNDFVNLFGAIAALTTTNHIQSNVNGALTDYWTTNGAAIFSKQLAP